MLKIRILYLSKKINFAKSKIKCTFAFQSYVLYQLNNKDKNLNF